MLVILGGDTSGFNDYSAFGIAGRIAFALRVTGGRAIM